MAINEILPFAPNAKETQGDILSQADYEGDVQRLNGQSGLGRRALNNKALRQANHMAAGVAQFIANRYEGGVKDDGDLDKVEEGLQAAVIAIIDQGAYITREEYESLKAYLLRRPIDGGDFLDEYADVDDISIIDMPGIVLDGGEF